MLVEEIVGQPISEDWKKSIEKAVGVAGAGIYLGAAGLGAGSAVKAGYDMVNPTAQTRQHVQADDFDRAGNSVSVMLPPISDPDDADEKKPEKKSTKVPASERLLALTIWAEARSHGEKGMRAVGWVIKNRSDSNLRRFHAERGIKGVVWSPEQFSCWNKGDPNRDAMENISKLPKDHADRKAWRAAKRIAHQIMTGQSRDPTKGSLFYHTTEVDPSWNNKMNAVAQVGNHIFYRGDKEVIGAAKRAAGRLLRRWG
jgi:spore germination cell wall hydrolase CwlJ-like protein